MAAGSSLRKRNQVGWEHDPSKLRASKRAKSTRSTEINWGEDADEKAELEALSVVPGAVESTGDSVEDSAIAAAAKVREEREARETVAEKRRRLAKEYLQQLDEAHQGDEDGLNEAIHNRLQDDQLRAAGRLQRAMADRLADVELVVRRYRGHKLPATCVAVTPDGRNAFTGSKDGSIVRWCTETGRRLCVVSKRAHKTRARLDRARAEREGEAVAPRPKRKHKPYHIGAVHALAVSPDGRHLVSGGEDALVRVWDVEAARRREGAADAAAVHGSAAGAGAASRDTCAGAASAASVRPSGSTGHPNNAAVNRDAFEFVDGLPGHRDAVSGLAFRAGGGAGTLYSCSRDRTVKLWSVDEMAYIETLFGHQSDCNAVAALRRERCVTAGRDNSVRCWKIPEESQLVFHGKGGSHDCVAMVNETFYVTGTDTGHLCLFSQKRKKPAHVVKFAHGEDVHEGECGGGAASWITAVACLRDTDVVASGSSDGLVRFWRADLSGRGCLRPVGEVRVEGFVNGLAFSPDGGFLAAAVGSEHRLGRWWRHRGAGRRPGLAIVETPMLRLRKKEAVDAENEQGNGSSDEEESSDGGESSADDEGGVRLTRAAADDGAAEGGSASAAEESYNDGEDFFL